MLSKTFLIKFIYLTIYLYRFIFQIISTNISLAMLYNICYHFFHNRSFCSGLTEKLKRQYLHDELQLRLNITDNFWSELGACFDRNRNLRSASSTQLLNAMFLFRTDGKKIDIELKQVYLEQNTQILIFLMNFLTTQFLFMIQLFSLHIRP